MSKVYVLKYKGYQDEEYENCGVFTSKKNIEQGKREFKKQFPLLCEECTWMVDEYELDKFKY